MCQIEKYVMLAYRNISFDGTGLKSGRTGHVAKGV